MENFSFEPVGYIKCKEKYKYEQPRQGALQESESILLLNKGKNFEQALNNVDGFEYLWLIFVFHQNQGWKPMVNPPRLTSGKKVGLFSTRSPYRPNSIGLSCVKLVKREGLKLYLSGSDLLDETPVLDIKPYLSYSDSFPDAKCGWIEETADYKVIYCDKVKNRIEWLESNSGLSFYSFIKTQLSFDPLSAKRKRLEHISGNAYILAYRTWRIEFSLSGFDIYINNIFSGYSDVDLNTAEDIYNDKNIHRLFIKTF